MTVERPVSIRWFERLAYLSLVLSVANFMIVHSTMRQASPDLPDGRRGAVLVLMIVILAVYLPLIRLAAHRASNVARWILVVLLGVHLLGLSNLRAIPDYGGVSAVIAIIQFPFSVVLLWLMFRADARRWFHQGKPIDPEIFR